MIYGWQSMNQKTGKKFNPYPLNSFMQMHKAQRTTQ